MLVILDRDGVINEDSDAYIKSLDEWRPIAGAIDAIAALSRAGFTVAVATNQSGVARGLFDLDDLEAMHQHLNELVEAAGGRVAGIFYCAHHPDDDCNCRKPRTGLIEAIESELGESALGAWFIGDSLKDLEAAEAHGCEPVLVLTGKGTGTRARIDSDAGSHWRDVRTYPDLATAARALIQEHH